MKTSLVVTSISGPNRILTDWAEGARTRNISFLVIGDTPSPADFELEGCAFYSLAKQKTLDLTTAALVPERHYARKNLGYLLAMQDNAELILETDDDNCPRAEFWNERIRVQQVPASLHAGWINAYSYFSEARIWPRGLPLDTVQNAVTPFEHLPHIKADCPIQQGLADENPDVDAVYRLVLPLPQSFRQDRRIALGPGSWCPFNSQNTAWWREAFPLLYLPAYCSFRMTDIWRSLVAQRIAWVNNWSVLFHEPTVWQERNDHNLMCDFADEIPGYLHNRRIGEVLEQLDMQSGTKQIPDNLRRSYEALVRLGVIGKEELPLLEAWLQDLNTLAVAK